MVYIMKQIKNVCFWVFMMMAVLVISSCGGDDSQPVDLNSYILGNWRSYRVTGFYQGETINMDVDKTGPLSMVYWEMNFKQNGIITMGYWKPEYYTTWGEENYQYSIKGNMVTLTDSNGESIDLVFKDYELCLKLTQSYNGSPLTLNVFLRK